LGGTFDKNVEKIIEKIEFKIYSCLVKIKISYSKNNGYSRKFCQEYKFAGNFWEKLGYLAKI